MGKFILFNNIINDKKNLQFSNFLTQKLNFLVFKTKNKKYTHLQEEMKIEKEMNSLL